MLHCAALARSWFGSHTQQHHSDPIDRQDALQSADLILTRTVSRRRYDHFGPHRESDIFLFVYYAAFGDR